MKLFNKILYHGTPHKFDKFDMEHIRTGEGEMRHGWGLSLTLSQYGFDGIHYDGLRDNSCYVIFNPEN